MAAYAALVSLFNDLELIPNHPTHSFSFDNKQISSLSQTVQFLIDFMETYDSHGCTREAAEVLESRIAPAAHAAHDVLESHVVDQIHAGSTRSGKARSYFLLDLQKATDDMEFVKRKAMQFKAKSGPKAEQPTYSSAAPTSSQPSKNDMVGFNRVVVQLMEILTGEPSNQRLVIPIAGMGGLGKTSLAKTVYQHSSLKHHFDVRLWATISQKYSAANILTQLLCKSTTGGNVNELGEQLHKRLWSRRYLIVLDDMWSEGAWDEVHRFLPDNGNGSRVVVTTRLSDLAVHLNSCPFKLKFLDQHNSWKLFCGKTFGEEDCPVELEEIGKKIVKRCGGLPLSIVVIGGHLKRSSRAIEYWEKVANYMNPISRMGEEEQCLEILSLSYHHLHAYLKPCFLYLGIFREDERIDCADLLRCWIGEGFLKPKKGLSLEEVGEDCLKDLIDRNLILSDKISWDGKVEWCKIHDTVRELCLKVCEKEKFMSVVEDTTHVIGCSERRIATPRRKKLDSDTIGAKQSAPLLRTLVYGGGDSLLNELLVDHSLLRVLVRDTGINHTRLPVAHFQQVNMRTLIFNDHDLHTDSTCTYPVLSSACWNLQTLSMCCCPGQPLINVPYEIWEMPQLRHLRVASFFVPDPQDEGSKQEECIVLQNLHTLESVMNLRLTEDVCKRMPNLEKLSLWYNHFYDDCCFHNLGRFNKLKRLWMKFDDDSRWCDVVLSLTFPASLEELRLINCHLHWQDLTTILTSLPHLGLLELRSVRGSEWNLDEEEFSCLKILDIHSCAELISLNADSSHFPVLESLSLHHTPKLSEIPPDIGEIPTLRLIELKGCSLSAAVSAVRMVMEQETNGNYDLRLDVFFQKSNREESERFQVMMQEECLTTRSLHLIYYEEKMVKSRLMPSN